MSQCCIRGSSVCVCAVSGPDLTWAGTRQTQTEETESAFLVQFALNVWSLVADLGCTRINKVYAALDHCIGSA
eukprot:3936058-Rhodomonas_salina.1